MSEDSVVMRNMADGRYELACNVCRVSVVPHLPVSMSDFITVKQFEKEHKNCKQQPMKEEE